MGMMESSPHHGGDTKKRLLGQPPMCITPLAVDLNVMGDAPDAPGALGCGACQAPDDHARCTGRWRKDACHGPCVVVGMAFEREWREHRGGCSAHRIGSEWRDWCDLGPIRLDCDLLRG